MSRTGNTLGYTRERTPLSHPGITFSFPGNRRERHRNPLQKALVHKESQKLKRCYFLIKTVNPQHSQLSVISAQTLGNSPREGHLWDGNITRKPGITGNNSPESPLNHGKTGNNRISSSRQKEAAQDLEGGFLAKRRERLRTGPNSLLNREKRTRKRQKGTFRDIQGRHPNPLRTLRQNCHPPVCMPASVGLTVSSVYPGGWRGAYIPG